VKRSALKEARVNERRFPYVCPPALGKLDAKSKKGRWRRVRRDLNYKMSGAHFHANSLRRRTFNRLSAAVAQADLLFMSAMAIGDFSARGQKRDRIRCSAFVIFRYLSRASKAVTWSPPKDRSSPRTSEKCLTIHTRLSDVQVRER
jgi:hypothetical protein